MNDQTVNENTASESGQTQAAFEHGITLARALDEAVRRRSVFLRTQGVGDLSVEEGQYLGGTRADFALMELKIAEAKHAFDEAVADKKGLLDHLRKTGEGELADRVGALFHIKQGLFARLFGNHR